MASEESLLLRLPSEILENILYCLPYETICNSRLICKVIDRSCQHLLNQGFCKVDKYHTLIQKVVKQQLPRRESERRNHPLARHVDILAAIETRLSLLNMTYMKYIDLSLCCFIPGKVLDEIFRVLTYIKNAPTPPRAHELLQELRDISSMAMEHFDEKIVPLLKVKMPSVQLSLPCLNETFSGVTNTVSGNSPLIRRPPALREELLQIRHNLRSSGAHIVGMRKELQECKNKICDHKRHELEQDKKIAEQERKIVDLNKKILEYDQKFEDILAEIGRVRSSDAGPSSLSMGQIVAATNKSCRDIDFISSKDDRLPDRIIECKVDMSLCCEKGDESENNVNKNLRKRKGSNKQKGKIESKKFRSTCTLKKNS